MIGSSKITETIIRENAFEHKKKKPGLNLTENLFYSVTSIRLRFEVTGKPILTHPILPTNWPFDKLMPGFRMAWELYSTLLLLISGSHHRPQDRSSRDP